MCCFDTISYNSICKIKNYSKHKKTLEIFLLLVYNKHDCAMWGVSGALFLQSAQQGRKSFSETIMKAEWICLMLKKRSCARVNCEPCQVRKEAALSKSNFVPQGNFFGVRQTVTTLVIVYNKECTVFLCIKNSTNKVLFCFLSVLWSLDILF